MPPPNSNHWETDPEYIELLNYLINKTKNVKSPINIKQLVREFKEKSRAAQSEECLRKRIENVRTRFHTFEHIDKKAKVKLLFALSCSANAYFLKELKKDALVEVDEERRIIHYKANDGNLELKRNQRRSAKGRTVQLGSKGSLLSFISKYFENKNDADAVPANKEEKEVWNFFEFITEKCQHVDSPLNIHQLARDFNKKFGVARAKSCIRKRVKVYCREIQTLEFLDSHSKVKLLFGLSESVDPNFLKELRKDDIVEVDERNRITHYKANDGSLELRGDHSQSAKVKNARFESKRSLWSWTIHYFEKKNNSDAIPKNKEEKEMGYLIDFITEKSEEIETKEDGENVPEITGNEAVKTRSFSIETLPKRKTSSSTPHAPKTPKRKADASGSNSSKRTRPSSDETINPGEMDDNISHDDQLRNELKPFRGILGPPNGIGEDPDIQHIPRPHPQVMEAPIKKEYVEEAQTSLKMILNAFKSLVLSLDTPGLSQLQLELDKRIMETGRGVEVFNKKVILAMEFLIVKLSKHGAPKSPEDSISLRDILLMLRTIILNSSFNGLEGILEMLKENIELLKVLDKKVPVSKVDCVLRATLDNICT